MDLRGVFSETENKMSKFKVEIEYKKAPAFSVNVDAVDSAAAKRQAQLLALACGFAGQIKKIEARAA